MQQVAYWVGKMNRYLVFIHIVAGSMAVFGMLAAWISKKGSPVHRFGGKVYSLSMALGLIVALVLSFRTDNLFLGLIVLFTAYLIYSGWRYATVRDGSTKLFDFFVVYSMLGVSFAMFVYGGYLIFMPDRGGIQGFGPVMIAFAVLGGVPAWEDLKFGQNRPRGKERIVKHLARMGAASIATVTAVFVVNIKMSPAFIPWLLPTVAIVPLIVFYVRKVRGQ